ncbi:pyroglutamyl-peptidase I [Caldalkalibacillus mannanilyticus]|uniref:pyroglutamyl-peptidase I n=1 Tax=Caldalkalibacillus mannanilyticus TaxID=1418 RepID=UPI0004696B2C|nr:pyroglutamyl-peptidase I [Caldalkalibacillus mannanilyticus]
MRQKKLLLTGFEPFLDHPINPTEQIVKTLEKRDIGEYQVYGHILPVRFNESAKELIDVFEEIQPDVVISLGLAAGRNRITPERVAINCNDGEPDNEGMSYCDQAIQPDGPAAYFSTLPLRQIVDTLQEHQFPAEISNSAGTYLCNNIMYQMLHYIDEQGLDVRSGFIHIPASHELTIQSRKGYPSWSMESLISALQLIISCLDNDK